MSSNNVGHLINKTITTLQHLSTLHHTSPNYTSLHLSTLHHYTATLRYTSLHFTTLHPTTLHYTYRYSITTLQHFAILYHTSLNYTSLHLPTLHFLSFTLHCPLICLHPITFPIVLSHLTSLN